MIYDFVSVTSICVLFAVSLWCIFSTSYDDGVIGKLIFIMLALACYAAMSEYPQRPTDLTRATMLTSMAAAAVRHVFLVHIANRIPIKRIRNFFYD